MDIIETKNNSCDFYMFHQKFQNDIQIQFSFFVATYQHITVDLQRHVDMQRRFASCLDMLETCCI